jgi:hypothetical protein
MAWFKSEDQENKDTLARWISALARCTMYHLRGNTTDIRVLLDDLKLKDKELDLLERSHHRYERVWMQMCIAINNHLKGNDLYLWPHLGRRPASA